MKVKQRIRLLVVGTLLMWLISFIVFAILLLRIVDVELVVIRPAEALPLAFLISFSLLVLASSTLLLAHSLS